MGEIIGLKELRNNIDKYVSQIRSGKILTVVRKSKPLFKLSPPEKELWETVVDFTKNSKRGVSARDLLKHL